MGNWEAQLSIDAFGYAGRVALTNEWGRNYPSFIDDLMPDLLGLRPGDRVLDVGGGQYPFKRAQLSVDAYVSDDVHRQGKGVTPGHGLVGGYGERLPLRDGSFDFVIARHTLEHVADPEAVAAEMTRVARRGFSDSPNSIWEPLLGFPPHLWLIDVEDGALVFRRRPWVRGPLGNPLRPFWWYDAPVRYDFELRYRNVFNAQHLWEGEMRVRVEDDGRGFDYGDPEQAAEAHLDFALNAMRGGRAPFEEVEQDIAMALRWRPEWGLAHNARGVLLWQAGRHDEALTAFGLAAEMEPVHAEFRDNARLKPGADARPTLVMLPEDDPPRHPDLKTLRRELRIGAKAKVLEVTNGEPWFAGSETASLQPDGTLVPRHSRYDAVIVRDGLGTMADLAGAFSRIEALAERGYVEIPSRMMAAFESRPEQEWYAERFGSSVRACRRESGLSPCHHILAALRKVDPRVEQRLAANAWGLARIGHVWEGRVGIPIARVEEGYDPADQAQRAAAESAFRTSMSRLGLPAEEGATARIPITVITHTWNEEHDIEECLASAHGWADEIIVMDMESTDRTREIAARYADKVLTHPHMQICEPARNAALEAASNEWVLYLDADERLTPEIRTRIEEAIRKGGDSFSAVQLPYKNMVFGRWIRHAGAWWPGYKAPMLVKKGKVQFQPEIHSLPKVDGPSGRLQPSNEREAIVHHTFRTLYEWIEKANRFTNREADAMQTRGHPVDWREAARRFGAQIALYYDQTNGKQDGTEGWLLSLCAGVYELFSQMKYWEALKDQEGFEAGQCMPPSAAEFLSIALQAAQAEARPQQAAREAEPQWILPLVNFLCPAGRQRAGVFLGCPATAEQAKQAGWKVRSSGPCDAAVVWRCEETRPEELSKLASEARPGTLIIVGLPAGTDAKQLREKLETLFSATIHLLDPEAECSRIVAILWSGERIDAERKVLITVHGNALRMMGGGELVVFRSLLKALRQHGVLADVTAATRLDAGEYDLVHVVSLYQPDHAPKIRSWGKPTIVMPIYWDGPRVQWVTAVLPQILSPERSEEERRLLLESYARRSLAANDITVDGAQYAPEAVHALRSVRDCGGAIIATGPQELDEMERALGPTEAATGSIQLGIDPQLFSDASEKAFVEQFGLRDFVLCLGRIEPMKNQLMLAYALRGSGRKLVLMGGSSDPNYLALCKHWGGDDLVHIPSQPPSMVASALKAAACHALPSWWEVPGLASLEAAAAGCPVVATECGTIRHYLGDDARYCDPADPASIREAVLAACADKGSEKARRLQALCLDRFAHDRCAAAYRLAYDVLLEGGRMRLLVAPDWLRPDTWQPLVGRFAKQYKPESRVALCMLVDEPTGAPADEAERMLRGFCEQEGIDLESTPDVELTDIASVGTVAAVLASGSDAEKTLAERFGFRPVEWEEVWTERKPA
jgi:glycosyltransferase involved in cell wall biosynthesis